MMLPIKRTDYGGSHFYITDRVGDVIGGYWHNDDQLERDDADLICRAVNAFDDMVEAIRETKDMLARDTTRLYSLDYPEFLRTVDRLQAVLDKAEGKEK
jgi:hypothetical protein